MHTTLPVGTIISSFLNWEEFQNVTECNKLCIDNLFHSKRSIWSPCDGRLLDDESKLAKVTTAMHNVPDLRSLFLRGFNVIDKNENLHGISPVYNGDPFSNRLRGERQEDELKEHRHSYQVNKYNLDGSNSGTGNDPAKKHFLSNSTEPYGGAETRPKNMSVYYYIKIN